MTVDPNNPNPPDPQLELAPVVGDPPAPPVAAAGPTAEEVADLVIAKLQQAAAPPPAAPRPAIGKTELNSIEELMQQANDPEDPRRANAIATLGLIQRQGVDAEWAACGCPIGHPARALFDSNPQAFSGRPVYAFREWENQELRREKAERDAAKGKEPEPSPEEAEKERARKVRESAPGMPSRSVPHSPRAGKKAYDTLEDFQRAAANDPTLDDAYDRGEITIRNY